MECRLGLAMRILSVCPSVCLSVCPSVKRVNCDKTEEKSIQIFIPYERTFSLVFWEEEWLVRATHSTWNFGSTSPHWREIADFEPIIASSASAVRPSEKSSINTNKKSSTCFPTSLRWSSYIGGSNMQKGWFPCKIALRLKKVCYKVSLCVFCKAFIGLTNCVKMTGGGEPFYLKFWVIVTAMEQNRWFSIYFRS